MSPAESSAAIEQMLDAARIAARRAMFVIVWTVLGLSFAGVGALLYVSMTDRARAETYAAVSIGRSSTPHFFDTAARYAFPDLATGGGDCCVLTHDTDDGGDGFRLALGKSYENGFGIEGSLEYLGRLDSAFDTSGAFWTALGKPGVSGGRCVEAGRFRFSSITLAGTYRYLLAARLSIVPKLGVSAMLVDITSASRCTFQYADGTAASIEQPQDKQRFSFSPMAGLELRYELRRGLNLALGLEVRDRILVADTIEAVERDRGRIAMTSAWLGVSRSF